MAETDRTPRGLTRRIKKFVHRHEPLRALLWGAGAALALPPVHLLPVLLFSVPAFIQLAGGAGNWRRAALIGFAFGFGLNLAGLYWITEPVLTEAASFWWLVPFAAPLLAIAVAFYSIIPALAAYFVPAGPGRLLAFAGAWVLSNILQQFLFTGFPWNEWGTDWVMPGLAGDIFIQPAALVGVHGLTLFTLLLAGLPMLRRAGPALLLAGLFVWAAFGDWRLHWQTTPTGEKIALLQPNFPVPGSYERTALEARWNRLLAMSQAAIAQGAKTVVWPEAVSPWALQSDATARAQLAAVTGTTPILAGTLRLPGPHDYRNSLVVTEGPGPAVAFYDKWKLVPFGEYMPAWIPVRIIPNAFDGGFSPGPGPQTLKVPNVPAFGPLICYEDAFSGQIVQEQNRPDWLVTVTDDAWFGDSAGPYQHFVNARLRAVEEGLPLARAANSGISAMIDPFGRVRAHLPLDSEGVLLAPLPGHLPPTFYAQHGLVVPLMLALVATITGILIAFLI